MAETDSLLTHDKDRTVLTFMELDDVIETNFKTVRPDMTLEEMLHKSVSKSTRNIFPVVDKNEALVGIVLLDDMQRVMEKFQTSAAWNLPVIKDGKYAGFVSKSKLLTAYRRELINFTR